MGYFLWPNKYDQKIVRKWWKINENDEPFEHDQISDNNKPKPSQLIIIIIIIIIRIRIRKQWRAQHQNFYQKTLKLWIYHLICLITSSKPSSLKWKDFLSTIKNHVTMLP